MAHVGKEIWLHRLVSRQYSPQLNLLIWTIRILFMTGTSCIVIGFSFANEAGCKDPPLSRSYAELNTYIGLAVSTLLLISLGLTVLICGGVYEKYTTRECLFPPAMFKDLTAGMEQVNMCWDLIWSLILVIILVITFLHQVTFTSGTFYLALFYQERTQQLIGPTRLILSPRQLLDPRPWRLVSRCFPILLVLR